MTPPCCEGTGHVRDSDNTWKIRQARGYVGAGRHEKRKEKKRRWLVWRLCACRSWLVSTVWLQWPRYCPAANWQGEVFINDNRRFSKEPGRQSAASADILVTGEPHWLDQCIYGEKVCRASTSPRSACVELWQDWAHNKKLIIKAKQVTCFFTILVSFHTKEHCFEQF